MMAHAGHWNTCVNRLYYACFYAVAALLLQHDLSSSRHSGVLSLFNHHFVKTGIIARELAALYNELFTSRQVADYRALVALDEQQVRPRIPQVQHLVQRVGSLLAQNGGPA